MKAVLPVALIALCMALGVMQQQWERVMPYWLVNMTPRQEYVLGAVLIGFFTLVGTSWAVWSCFTGIPMP